VVWPAFDTASMIHLLGRGGHTQAAGLILMERYFILHLVCCCIALFQLGVEWLYTGKPVNKLNLYILVGALALSLVGRTVLQPNMSEEHLARVSSSHTEQERREAHRSYRILFMVTQTANVLLLGATGTFTWRMFQPASQPRFSASRFRG